MQVYIADVQNAVDAHAWDNYAYFGGKRIVVTVQFLQQNLHKRINPEEEDTWRDFLFVNDIAYVL